MSLLRMLLRAGVRQRWRSWLALSLLAALVVGLVLAGAATARRTATAFPRFEAAHGFDSFFYSVDPVPGVAALPSVASAIDVPTPISGAPRCACSHPINVDDFTVEEVPPGQLSEVTKLVAGSLPNQSDPSQVLASRTSSRTGCTSAACSTSRWRPQPSARRSGAARTSHLTAPWSPYASSASRYPRPSSRRRPTPPPTTSTSPPGSIECSMPKRSCSTSTSSACATAPPACLSSRRRPGHTEACRPAISIHWPIRSPLPSIPRPSGGGSSPVSSR